MTGLLNILGIGRVTLVDDGDEVQRLQVTEGARGSGASDRVLPDVVRAGEFGLASAPPLNSEALMVRLGGERMKSLVIALLHRASRPRGLKPGDTVLYDVRGRMVRLTADGIEVDGAGGPVTVVNATKVVCKCDVETTGDVIARSEGDRVSLAQLHDAYNLHNHPPVAAGAAWGSGPPIPKA